jgi:hypothetical protein
MAAIAGLGAAAFAYASWILPTPLVLPATSIFAVAAASLVAAVAWAAAGLPATERVTYWDVAGALTFIGICAALLSDPEQVIPLLETRRTDQTAGLD